MIRLACIAMLLVLGSQATAAEFLTEENPPLNFSEKGAPAGVSTAVVREMAKRANVAANFSVLSWTEAYSRAQQEPDTCVYSTARLPSRSNMFLWVGPIARGYWSAFALESFADTPTNIGTIKNWQMRLVKMRCTFQRHGPAHVNIRGFDFVFAKAKMFQHVKFEIIQLRVSDAQFVLAEISPKGELVEGKFDVECTAKSGFNFVDLCITKAFVF